MALMVSAQFAFFFSVQFMQHELGYGALRSGFAYLPLTLLIFATHGLLRLWLSQLEPAESYLGDLLVQMLLIGVGAGLSFMPITVAVLSGVAPKDAGAAAGVLQMAQQVGGSVGLAVLVTIYASGSVPGQVVPGMSATFYVVAALLAVSAIVAFVFLGRTPRSRSVPPQ